MKSQTNESSRRRRVVITGLGVVGPNGIGTDAYRIALRDGVSGVGAITLFDAEDLECRVAAEVKNLPTEISLTQQEARRVGRAVPLLRVATSVGYGRGGRGASDARRPLSMPGSARSDTIARNPVAPSWAMTAPAASVISVRTAAGLERNIKGCYCRCVSGSIP